MTRERQVALRVILAPGSIRQRTGPDPARASDATDGAAAPMVIAPLGDGRARIDGEAQAAALTRSRPPRARLTTGGGGHGVLLLDVQDAAREAGGVRRIEVVVDGWRFEVDVEPERRAALRDRATRARGDAASGGPVEVRAIIPGRVLSVDVADGDVVEAGQRVLVVEAMKMQNELRSPRAGTIKGVAVGSGQKVELGDLLLVVE